MLANTEGEKAKMEWLLSKLKRPLQKTTVKKQKNQRRKKIRLKRIINRILVEMLQMTKQPLKIKPTRRRMCHKPKIKRANRKKIGIRKLRK